MIAFPPCTHIALSGAAHFEKKRKDGRQKQAIEFFMKFTKTNITYWCIENPMNIMSKIYRPPDIKINPYDFGDPYQKQTWLWVHNLPTLKATTFDAPLFGQAIDKGDFVKYESGKVMPKWYAELSGNGKERSKTFPGIAKAMAEQWSEYIIKTIS